MRKYSSVWAFVPLALGAFLLRVYQLFYEVDFSQKHWSLFAVGGVLGAAVLALILLPLFFTDRELSGIQPKAGPVTGGLALLLGAVVIVEVVVGFLSGNVSILLSVSGAVAALFLMMIGINLIFGQNYKFIGIFAIIPVLWACIRLGVNFMKYTNIIHEADNLFDVLKMVSAVLFLFYHAKLLADTDGRRSYRMAQSFGLLCSLFCLICTLPHYLYVFSNGNGGLDTLLSPQLSDLILGLYALVFVLFITKNGRLSSPEEPAEKLATVPASDPETAIEAEPVPPEIRKPMPRFDEDAVIRPEPASVWKKPPSTPEPKEPEERSAEEKQSEHSQEYDETLSKIYDLIEEIKDEKKRNDDAF